MNTLELEDTNTFAMIDANTIGLTADVPRLQVFDLDFCPADFHQAVDRMLVVRGDYGPNDC